jgi:hypothetical protein
MPDCHLQRDGAAVAEAEEVGAVDVQMRQQRPGVVGRLLEAERPVDIRRVPVALLLERDDLPGAGERRQDLAEGGLDRVAAALDFLPAIFNVVRIPASMVIATQSELIVIREGDRRSLEYGGAWTYLLLDRIQLRRWRFREQKG